jgi:hypothetical protein
MNLSFRPAVFQDFDYLFPALFPRNPEVRDMVEYEWGVFLKHSPDLSMIVEDGDRRLVDRVVGFAQTVFVTDNFVEYIRSGPPPHVNQHASKNLPDGSWPLLSPSEIRAANSGGGLNALTTRWGWRDMAGDEEATRCLRAFMDRSYPLFYRGYRYKHLLMPAYGEWPYKSLLRAGYRLLTDYSDHFRSNPPAPAPDEHPYVLEADRETSATAEGTLVSRIFDYVPPRFFFKPHEQELLRAAILGYSEREIAETVSVGSEAVKKRWEAIYERVRDVDLCLLPGSRDGARGMEKRRHLLQYIREHLEEIRP